MPRVLTAVAVLIAAAGAIDPAVTSERTAPQPLAIVTLARPANLAGADAMAQQLRGRLADDFAIAVRPHLARLDASACPSDGGCLVVSDGTVPERLTAGSMVIGAVTIDRAIAPVRIETVHAPAVVALHGAASLTVDLDGDSRGPGARVEVMDGGVLVGKAAAAAGSRSATIEWTPVAEGIRRLRVRAMPDDGMDGPPADEVDVAVEVGNEPAGVLMFEPEATWLGTFVRRALAADPRFRLDARTRLAPGLVAADRGAALTSAALSGARAAIVTAPHALTAGEVDLLERFVRLRGGTIIVLPDRRPAGPVTRLLPSIAGERRDSTPQAAGPLRATEWLLFDETAAGITVLASRVDRPVVVSRAIGRGRVIVSGALDAWRFREANGVFNRYWTSVTAAAAEAAGPAVDVSLDPSLLAPGEVSRVTVEWRTLEGVDGPVTARASLRCGEGHESVVRLWPGPRPGVFTGLVKPPSVGTCELDAALTDPIAASASRALLVVEDPRRPVDIDALESAIRAHGGVVVAGRESASLVSRARAMAAARREMRESRPLRSPWWLVPFVTCLGTAWWLRRRTG